MAKEKKPLHPGQCIAIGLAIGNISLGICIGLGLGSAAALYEGKKKKDKEE